MSELISACYEGLCKVKTAPEIVGALEVVSALHQRFGPDQFTAYLGWHIGRGLATPDRAHLKALTAEVRDKEERDRLARQRVLLRVTTDLWLIGVLRSLGDVVRPDEVAKAHEASKQSSAPTGPKTSVTPEPTDAEPFPLEALKDMLAHDRDHINLPLVLMLVKTFPADLFGKSESQEALDKLHKTESAADPGNDDCDASDPPLTSTDMRLRFHNVLSRYFDSLREHLTRDQERLASQQSRNAEAYVRSGEVFEDRQASYDKLVKEQQRLITSAQSLAAALGLELPDLDATSMTQTGNEATVGLIKTENYLKSTSDNFGIWDDEDERRFYEGLIDVKQRVPAILLEDKKKSAPAVEANTETDQDNSKATSEIDVVAQSLPTEVQSGVIASKSVGAQVDAVLATLPTLANKDQVDQCAIDFCFLNSKASRNRLVKAVQEVPRSRVDLLPLYSRLIATLSEALPDIAEAIVTEVDEQFRSLQRRKTKEHLSPLRIINAKYISELTKFGIIPEHVIFHCLKVTLDDFTRPNIEVMATLLETCGRYLLRKEDSSPRMQSFLQVLQRKKAAQHLSQQDRMQIENAIYMVDPPVQVAIEQQPKSPLELYIHKLIYMELNELSVEKTIKQLRKLHWDQPETYEILRKIYTRPDEIKFGNLHLLAVILGGLHKYHQDFTIMVLDDVLEMISVGLDRNDFRENQRRVAEVRLLGELYNYRLVDTAIVVDMLFAILTHGHPGGYPRPTSEAICQSDLPDDYFRIQLVTSLLDVCGEFFDHGLARQKLDFFLTFFQYYVTTKENLPLDVEFTVQDTFATIRPKWALLTSVEEASRAFSDLCKVKYAEPATKHEPEPVLEIEADHDVSEGSSDEDANTAHAGADSASENGQEVEHVEGKDDDPATDSDDGDSHASSRDEDEALTVTRAQQARDPEEDAAFDRELALLMSESTDSRRSDKRQVFDVPLPLRRSDRDARAKEQQPDAGRMDSPQPTMTFDLLSRRGNRQQVLLCRSLQCCAR